MPTKRSRPDPAVALQSKDNQAKKKKVVQKKVNFVNNESSNKSNKNFYVPPSVALSSRDKASQLKLSDDLMTVTGDKVKFPIELFYLYFKKLISHYFTILT